MIVCLQYRKKLGYIGAKFLPSLPDSATCRPDKTTLITFRKPAKGRADAVLRNVSALTQLNLADRDITFYGVQTDSPLAPILIWDVAHKLPVGGTLRFEGDATSRHYLEREYFKDAFVLTERSGNMAAFQKLAKLDAENSDLESWTFGIPAGPEDATLLNACVKRILELDIPNKEILLCGRPGPNFQYWDKVRIVGEDITAPPVQICKKKNRLAQEAKYANLCIIHDRVFLPRSFMHAVRKFGNSYPFTAFQSLFFDDKWNMVPRRYSDFGVSTNIEAQNNLGVMRGEEQPPSKYAPAVQSVLETSGFLFANPHRLSKHTYPTGSLYLVKKSVWLRCPQNESLLWTEFEDVEHADRAAAMGIPSRVNPHAFTQSMISRPLLSVAGAAHIETRTGTHGLYRATLESFPFPRKPLIKKTEDQAVLDAQRFADTYAKDTYIAAASSSALTTRMRLRMIAHAIHGIRLPIRSNAITNFVLDFEKLIIGDQLPYKWREDIRTGFLLGGRDVLPEFFSKNPDLFNHAALRPHRAIFAKSLLDYLPSNLVAVKIGSFISAMLLGFHNHQTFVFSGGVFWRYKQIVDCTPFLRYASREGAPI